VTCFSKEGGGGSVGVPGITLVGQAVVGPDEEKNSQARARRRFLAQVSGLHYSSSYFPSVEWSLT
jgi:hypothetical protein